MSDAAVAARVAAQPFLPETLSQEIWTTARESRPALPATVEPSAAPHWSPWAKLAARVTLIAALAAIAAHLYCLVFDLQHKSYGDGPILAMIERLRSEPISAAWFQEHPYTLSCYGPAFYYASRAVAELGGWRNSIVPGRLVALAATLATAALAAAAAGRKTKSLDIGLLAAVIFLVSMPVSEWAPHARVDMLALAFSAAAYLLVGASRRSLVLSALCVAAGSLAKPTAAFSALCIAAHLLANRRYRDAGVFSLAVSALGAVVWGVAEWASDGFFLTSVLAGNRNPLILWHGYFFCYQFLSCPLGAAAVLATGQLLLVSPRHFARSLYSLSFVISLAISLVAICKQGSDLNYFLEPALLGSIALAVDAFPRLCQWGAGQGSTQSRPDRHGRRWLALAAVAFVLGLPFVREVKHQLRSPPKLPAAYAKVKSYLASEPSDVGVLADGRMVDMVLAAGRQPWLNDSYLYMLLVDNGRLDPAPLLERLRDGRIKWLFLRKTIADHKQALDRDGNCWPAQVIKVLPQYYELVEKKSGLWVYRHRRYRDVSQIAMRQY